MYAVVSGRLCLEGYVVDFNGRVGKTLIKPNLVQFKELVNKNVDMKPRRASCF